MKFADFKNNIALRKMLGDQKNKSILLSFLIKYIRQLNLQIYFVKNAGKLEIIPDKLNGIHKIEKAFKIADISNQDSKNRKYIIIKS